MGDGFVKQVKNGLTIVHVSLAAEVTNSQGWSVVMSNKLMNTSRSTEHVLTRVCGSFKLSGIIANGFI